MKKFWIGLALGALAGAVTLSLFAPQSGRSTRRKLRRSLEDFGDNLSDAAEYLKDQAEKLAKEAQQLLEDRKFTLEDALDTAQKYGQSTGAKVSQATSRLM